jgi:arylsulfatase A-like enzyme
MPERTLPNLLIVAVDGLRASALGAYGNTSYPTPALDEFAAESFLLDSCFAPSADLQALYRALWHSLHPLRPHDFAVATPLPLLFADRGYETTLVTDDPQFAALSASAGFAQCVQIENIATERADDVSQTAVARLFAAASEVMASSDRRQFVWVHSHGMLGPWDAPLELQDALRDEGDPPPVDAIDPPDLTIASGDDPDIAFRFACAYAAQVMVLDACWESLIATLQAAGVADDWLVTLMGVRGFPLGEHRRIGGVDERLYVEQLHTPWIIRLPDGRGCLARTGALTSHLDLLPTLIDAIGGGNEVQVVRRDGVSILPLVDKIAAPWREAVFSTSATGTRAIRTAGWSFRRDANSANVASDDTQTALNEASSGELFVRPDDRWEANDVAPLCSEVAAGFSQVIDAWSEQIRAGETSLPNKLPDSLRAYAT